MTKSGGQEKRNRETVLIGKTKGKRKWTTGKLQRIPALRDA